MHRIAFVAILALAASSTPGGSAAGDTVTLTSGKVLEEVETKKEGDKIRVTKADGSSVVYPLTMIKSIVDTLTTPDELAQRRKALPPKDAKARIDLGRWCEERDLPLEARKLYEDAVAIDPDCAEAHSALGHFQLAGTWLADLGQGLALLKKTTAAAEEYLNLGIACKKREDWTVLEQTATEALRACPDSLPRWIALVGETPIEVCTDGTVARRTVSILGAREEGSIFHVTQVVEGTQIRSACRPLTPKVGHRFLVLQLGIDSAIGRVKTHEEKDHRVTRWATWVPGDFRLEDAQGNELCREFGVRADDAESVLYLADTSVQLGFDDVEVGSKESRDFKLAFQVGVTEGEIGYPERPGGFRPYVCFLLKDGQVPARLRYRGGRGVPFDPVTK